MVFGTTLRSLIMDSNHLPTGWQPIALPCELISKPGVVFTAQSQIFMATVVFVFHIHVRPKHRRNMVLGFRTAASDWLVTDFDVGQSVRNAECRVNINLKGIDLLVQILDLL